MPTAGRSRRSRERARERHDVPPARRAGSPGALGNDLDTNNDGVLDLPAGVTLVDAIAVNDGGVGDLTYGGVTLGVAYDGLSFAPGGASRIPDGTDTDTPADWVRNDFDLAGIPGNPGTLVGGEA